jgi:ORF6N domain
MLQLTKAEAAVLRSQIAISNSGSGGRRYAPYVFTEQGVAMLSGVLKSKRAVAVNIAIMRAFVELRQAAAGYSALEERLDRLERDTSSKLGQHDEQLSEIFGALRQLISPPDRPKRPVGFRPPEDDGGLTQDVSCSVRILTTAPWFKYRPVRAIDDNSVRLERGDAPSCLSCSVDGRNAGDLLSRQARRRTRRSVHRGTTGQAGGEDRRPHRGAPERTAARCAAAGVPDQLADRGRAASQIRQHAVPGSLSALREPDRPAARLREEHGSSARLREGRGEAADGRFQAANGCQAAKASAGGR